MDAMLPTLTVFCLTFQAFVQLLWSYTRIMCSHWILRFCSVHNRQNMSYAINHFFMQFLVISAAFSHRKQEKYSWLVRLYCIVFVAAIKLTVLYFW